MIAITADRWLASDDDASTDASTAEPAAASVGDAATPPVEEVVGVHYCASGAGVVTDGARPEATGATKCWKALYI